MVLEASMIEKVRAAEKKAERELAAVLAEREKALAKARIEASQKSEAAADRAEQAVGKITAEFKAKSDDAVAALQASAGEKRSRLRATCEKRMDAAVEVAFKELREVAVSQDAPKGRA